jgi:hypothetical protein
MMTIDSLAVSPQTNAVRRALQTVRDESAAADLLFLEVWERERPHDLAATLRFSQIRRANPTLAAEIHAELAGASAR